MIDVHQNATLSESFEGDRSRVIGNRCELPKLNFFICCSTRIELLFSVIFIVNFNVPENFVRKVSTISSVNKNAENRILRTLKTACK